MDNSNFWDWDNEDEHRVSSVYRDADEENVKTQDNVSPNNTGQNVHLQSSAVPNNTEQDAKEENAASQASAAQTAEVQSDVVKNVSDKQTNTAPSEVVAENNFILVDNPQNTTQNNTPQAEISYAQTEYQQTSYAQTEYQQIGNPQADNPQTEYQPTENQQPNNQQTGFQQMIPVQSAQQNQGTSRQKAKQDKYADYTSTFDQKDISENKVSAMAAYLLGPVGIIIALLVARDSAYAAFHVREALKITICSVVLEIIAAILALFAMIPLVGIIFKLVLIIICAMWLGVLILRLIAIAQVCDGEARQPSIIGKMNCFH